MGVSIIRPEKNVKIFQGLNVGDPFEVDGKYYMKVVDIGTFNAFDLETGEHMHFLGSRNVRVVDLKVEEV